ncbi:hypothetical protein NVP1004O_31 [Vibrio phage 1.004.O._10N.261.54.A2]|nr:hypothetical protein NVP1004O_31 [Vibrio phage 1.004.O._10N.261.54.A2]
MKNLKQREVMKAFYLANLALSYAAKVAEQVAIHGFLGIHATTVTEDALKRQSQIPVNLFRHDKPELDKRRVNRFHRKQHPWCKGSWLVQPTKVEVVVR